MSVAYMSDEARAYYAGGRRVMRNGVPCRVAAHGSTPGKAFIKAAVAGQVEIQPESNRCFDAPYFRFTPAESAEPKNCKPSNMKGYAYKARFKSISGWRPANLAGPRYAAHCSYGGTSLTDTPGELGEALADYQGGNPAPLRQWLADTADERRAYWAAVDAQRATDEFVDWKIDSEAADDWRQAA